MHSDSSDSYREEQKCTNLDYLKHLTKGNPKMIVAMINVYLEENPKHLNKMKQEIENRDWESLARTTHLIKPSFSTMGISKEFTDTVNEIQEHADKKEKPETIKELFLKIETICSQAREEVRARTCFIRKI